MARASRTRTNPRIEPPTATLRLSGPSERLRAAALEHEKLVAQVARKRRDLDRLHAEVRTAVTEVAGRVQPLAEELKHADAAIHALFDEILASKRSRRARSQIHSVYVELQETGVISPIDEPNEDIPPLDFDGRSHGHASHGPPEVDAPSAPKQHDRGALRDLYRRLVELIHPDQVQDEVDKTRRTEAMKEVTVAFRESDFGRLVEIERVWAVAEVPLATDDDIERRLAAIDAQNGELRKQLRALDKQLRSLRRSPGGQLTRELDRKGKRGRDAAIAGSVEELEEALRGLREIHDFVALFRDGKMSLDEFMAGPDAGVEEDDVEVLDLDEVFADVLRALDEELATAQRAPARRSGGRKRKPR